MSALGQKQTLERALRMSALPPKADIMGLLLKLTGGLILEGEQVGHHKSANP